MQTRRAAHQESRWLRISLRTWIVGLKFEVRITASKVVVCQSGSLRGEGGENPPLSRNCIAQRSRHRCLRPSGSGGDGVGRKGAESGTRPAIYGNNSFAERRIPC